MPIVDIQGVHRSYGERTVLDGVNATIRSRERVGLVGDNGAGKSTLARILAGLESPDSGALHLRRGARVAYLAQVPTLPGGKSALEVVLHGLEDWTRAKLRHDAASTSLLDGGSRADALLEEQSQAAADLERLGGWDVEHRGQALLAHVGIQRVEQSVDQMSGGEQRRVALAQLLMSAPDLAILDEPTNHLDIDTIEWLERYLQVHFEGALLLVTHDRYVLDRVVARTWELEQGKLFSYEGGYAAYLEGKAEREAHRARVERNRQNFLRRELEWLRRSPKARTTKQKARVDRAEAAVQAPSVRAGRELALRLEEVRAGKTVLELRKLDVRIADRELVVGLDLIVSKGERLGVLGPNGAGKSTLLKAILGEVTPVSGEIVVGKNVALAYLSQARDSLDPEASVLENVAGGRLRVDYGGRDLDARGYLQQFFFDHVRQNQPVKSLSGGERTRVALAKLLCQEANLLLLDEPTNDLDVSTLGALEEMLLAFGGSALVVTHDRFFLDRIATSLLVTGGDGCWLRYAGNYRDYRAQLAQSGPSLSAALEEQERSAGRPDKRIKPSPGRSKGLTYAERIELEGLPERVDEAEERVSGLQSQLADPDLYRERGDQVAGVKSELASAQDELGALWQRWEALEARK